MPLKIELKPGEKFIVNGAVIVAGRTGASLALKNRAVLLRGRDVMQEEEATTPSRRVYFSLMLMYIDPDNRAAHAARFEAVRGEYAALTTLEQTRTKLDRIRDLAGSDAFYPALKLCKDLIAFEDGLLAGTAAASRGEAA